MHVCKKTPRRAGTKKGRARALPSAAKLTLLETFVEIPQSPVEDVRLFEVRGLRGVRDYRHARARNQRAVVFACRLAHLVELSADEEDGYPYAAHRVRDVEVLQHAVAGKFARPPHM